MYKYYIDDLPLAFKKHFSKPSDIHEYSTRQVGNLNSTFDKKSFSDNAIRTTGPILWNSLPQKLKDSKTVKHSRSQYKIALPNF